MSPVRTLVRDLGFKRHLLEKSRPKKKSFFFKKVSIFILKKKEKIRTFIKKMTQRDPFEGPFWKFFVHLRSKHA